MEYREPETVHKVINGVEVYITYTHKKSLEEVKQKLLKIILSD